MSKFRFTPTRFFKWIFAVGFLLVIFWIANNFVTQLRMRRNVSEKTEELSPQKVETTQKVRHYESEEGGGNLLFEADKHYIGDDNLFHGEGNVKIVLPKKVDGEDVHVIAEEVIHDQENSFVRVKGKTQIRVKDLEVEAYDLEYIPETEIFQTDLGLSFSSERLSGMAQKVRYRLKTQRLKMSQDVRLRLDPELESKEPIHVQGQDLDFWYKQNKGILTGEAKLVFGESWVETDSIAFELSRDKAYVKAMEFVGKVVAHLVTEETLDLRGDEMQLKTFLQSNDVRSLKAQGDCFFSLLTAEGDSLTVESASLDMTLSREGELRNFEADQNVRMFETREGEEREVEGEFLESKDRGKSLRVKGKEGRQARIRTQRYEITADDLSVLLESKNLEAQGEVSVILKSGVDQSSAVGFFSKESPVFIDADEMRYSDEHKRFLFKGNIKVWQGKDMMETSELLLFRDSGKILCRERVRTRLTFKSQQGEDADPSEEVTEKQIDITAKSMEFDPEKRRIFYREKVVLSADDLKLEAGTLYMDMDQAAGELKTVTARENVRIERAEYQGHGQKAVYDVGNEIIVLTGKPVLIDKNRGKVEGHKLTFHLADDRIIVENKDRERSETVIKS
ncbi:MAG: hypothetical protein GQ544_06825 [Candidatus Aminicenantes bacterium]|nr:hypothetical protein [Candidatus Aminicenantes bacterium]